MTAYDPTEAERICGRIRAHLPNMTSGTLRIWGQWFGRPHDNIHTIVNCSADDDVLCVTFDAGESLTIWSPRQALIGTDSFRVETATRVRWEWFYYGRPQTPENLHYLDYRGDGVTLTASTNVTWAPTPITSVRGPAAELV